MLKPLKLTPSIKTYIWGGDRLKTDFNKLTDLDHVGESWELSCHPAGMSMITDPDTQEIISLAEYITKTQHAVLGTNCRLFDDFPVLIKLIDAKDKLSVQVHPSDEFALEQEGQYGKTEMWYVVDAAPEAELIYGFRGHLTPKQLRLAIESGTLMELLNVVPVRKGDVLFIEAGIVHAIGKDIVIAEIQQNSNITYRLYDYDRTDMDGNKRELHVDKAVQVSALEPASRPVINVAGNRGITQLAQCRYFTTHLVNIDSELPLSADSLSFHALLCLDDITLCWGEEQMSLLRGDSVFIPANMGAYILKGNGCVILTTV